MAHSAAAFWSVREAGGMGLRASVCVCVWMLGFALMQVWELFFPDCAAFSSSSFFCVEEL